MSFLILDSGTSVGPATAIAINGGNAQDVTVNTAVSVAPSAVVSDAGGNGVSGVAVTFAVIGGAGAITGGAATTDAFGVATLGSWTLGTVAGLNTLSATAAGLTGSPLTFTATGTAGAATTIAAASVTFQGGSPGTPVGVLPQVLTTDAFGNVVAGVSVTFAVTAGGGSGTGLTPTTGGDGTAMVGSWTLGGSVGTNTMTATSTGLTGSPVSFTVQTSLGGGLVYVLHPVAVATPT